MAKHRFPLARAIPATTPPGVFVDARGTFQESWTVGKGVPAMKCGLTSGNKQGALRGLHFQRVKPRALIVRCVVGMIWDVTLDLRNGSPTFGKIGTVRLADDTGEALFVPPGYAHGFYAMSEAIVIYECSEPYSEESAAGVNWKAVAQAWRGIVSGEPIVSEKDAALPMEVDPIDLGGDDGE